LLEQRLFVIEVEDLPDGSFDFGMGFNRAYRPSLTTLAR
jgi:hypothetical protein